jgi:hypothetical protein
VAGKAALADYQIVLIWCTTKANISKKFFCRNHFVLSYCYM